MFLSQTMDYFTGSMTQPASPNAHITFTPGTDSSGLFKSYLPMLLKDGTATSISNVNTTTTNVMNPYPLPGQ